jgi:glycosyltransferase involved in cell wall biosynthesis
MKIAYVTTYDASDPHAWSGLGYHIHNGLTRHGMEVHLIHTLPTPKSIANRLSHRFWPKLGKRYLDDRDPGILRAQAREVERQITSQDFDLILSPGTLPLAYLRTEIPMVLWTDATFASLLDYYEHFTGVCGPSIRHGHRAERLALGNARLAVYSSSWAANSAVRDYGAPAERVRVIPFGANLDRIPDREEIAARVAARSGEVCALLFIGVEWERKGGAKALAIAAELAGLGVPTTMDIVGISADLGNLPAGVRSHGYLRKDNPAHCALLDALFAKCHFLVLPTLSDCVPVVIAEANVNGIPAVTHDTGGISSVVLDAENGLIFEPCTPAREMAARLASVFADFKYYKEMAMSAYDRVREHQDWDKCIEQFLHEIGKTI